MKRFYFYFFLFFIQFNLLAVNQTNFNKNLPKVDFHDKQINELYNLAVSEIIQNINSEGSFYAGAKWQGVWTRDSSYAIDLGLSFLFPQNVETTLKSCILNGQIKQDTGTGGGYPISSDRVVWGLAAFSYAKFINSVDFYQYIYEILSNSIEYDENVIFDIKTGLFRGETSFLDWREQTYCSSLDCNSIGNSFSLSTNVLHKIAYDVLAKLSQILNDEKNAKSWLQKSDDLKKSIKLSFSDSSYKHFCSYIIDYIKLHKYFGYDNLANSLLILADIVDTQKAFDVLNAIEPTKNGLSVVSPQISGISSYHNNAIWSFVQAYRVLAAKQIGDYETAELEFDSLVKFGSLFGTFKENFTADTADMNGTETNSDRQLWSDAGFVGCIYRVLFGINVEFDGIHINPLVFKRFQNGISLQNLKIGNTVLNIVISGTGNNIKSYKIDGQIVSSDYVIPRDTSLHNIQIEMQEMKLNFTKSETQWNCLDSVPMSPIVDFYCEKNSIYLEWNQNGNKFDIFRNDALLKQTEELFFQEKINKKFVTVYNIQTKLDKLPTVFGSFIRIDDKKNTIFYEAENAIYNGGIYCEINDAYLEATNVKDSSEFEILAYNGKGYISKFGNNQGDSIDFKIKSPINGDYVIDIRYQNGHGPINTGSHCAIVALYIDEVFVRRIPLAQRGSWLEWGFSSPVVASLSKGTHEVKLVTDKFCHNERGEFSYFNIDLLRVGLLSNR